MSIIEFPPEPRTHTRTGPTPTTEPVLVDTPNNHHRSALPRRFDVHQIDTIVDELRLLGATGEPVELDGSSIEMIDLAALEALAQLVDELCIWISSPSVALRATARFTGHVSVAACFADLSQESAA
jgi:hypothetical protein